jgi:hypothetical protein
MKTRCESYNSCGMTLETQEDYALGNITANLCRYCVDEQGNLLDYRTILKNNVS